MRRFASRLRLATPSPGARRRLVRQPATLALRYVLVSLAWLALSDPLFEWWLAGSSWRPYMLMLKGLLFVLLSTAFIYVQQRRAVRRFLESVSVVERLSDGYRMLCRDLPTPCMVVDAARGHILEANAAAARLYGWSRRELCALPLSALMVDPAESPRSGPDGAPVPVRQATREGGELDVRIFRSVLPLDTETVELWVCVDATLERRAADLLRLQAQVDPLTGLPGRALVHERLERALRDASSSLRLALLLVDIDQFKLINDTRGHSFGDLHLREVAARLSAFAGPHCTVARFGGDEFVLLQHAIDRNEDPLRFAETVRAAVARASVLEGEGPTTTCSIGIAVHPHDGADAETLFSAADAALGRAKAGGRNDAVRFLPAMRREASHHASLIQNLRHALERGELRVRYQPQFALSDGGMVGIEALSAWTRADGEEVPASEFIPAAERGGLITGLGHWVLGEVLQQLQDWRAGGLAVPALAINVSPVQLQSAGFAERVIEEVHRLALPARSVELEITETVALNVDTDVLARVRRLADAGVGIVIDDFGRGYSSLAHFTRLPIHKVKVDASFVRNIERAADRQAIVRSMLSMARSLGLYTVAEGVERSEERDWLRDSGCDAIQGYLCGRPQPPDRLRHILQPGSATLHVADRTWP